MEFSIKQSQENNGKGKFYLEKAQERVAHIDYHMENDSSIVIDRTEVIPSFREQGIGKQLVDKVLRFADAENFELKSDCPYFSRQWEKMK